MKKLLLLTLVATTIFSCTSNPENSTPSISNTTTNTGTNTTNTEVKTVTNTGELISDETKDELKKITHNNFKPLMEALKKTKKEVLATYDCPAYFYLPEAEKRPAYQLDIQKEYIAECEKLKK